MKDRHQGLVALLAIGAAIGLGYHFVQLRHGEDAVRACVANLEHIQAAKDQFALEHAGVGPTNFEDVIPVYLPELPHCPLEGTYTLGELTEPPRCSIEGHALLDDVN